MGYIWRQQYQINRKKHEQIDNQLKQYSGNWFSYNTNDKVMNLYLLKLVIIYIIHLIFLIFIDQKNKKTRPRNQEDIQDQSLLDNFQLPSPLFNQPNNNPVVQLDNMRKFSDDTQVFTKAQVSNNSTSYCTILNYLKYKRGNRN
eukprot:TRINITY_DN5114_c0_g1_i1.p1 TRINITY_DN5114_c0_g1~~TRINITY_DN5114_c0_g1_i1.p1  ORF type:complete len:144 (-),score=15.06 TRINITY_DN5114_c0_g1_i1:269-700(-)